jgi:hypothetical protein
MDQNEIWLAWQRSKTREIDVLARQLVAEADECGMELGDDLTQILYFAFKAGYRAAHKRS